MERVSDLTSIVRREVADYNNANDWKATGYFLEDSTQQAYAILIVPDPDHPHLDKPLVMMMARVVDDKVVIDADVTDRPLYEELMRAGIPREQIVLAYAGETIAATK